MGRWAYEVVTPFAVRVSFAQVRMIFKLIALISSVVISIRRVASVEANQETAVLKGSRVGIDGRVQFDLH